MLLLGLPDSGFRRSDGILCFFCKKPISKTGVKLCCRTTRKNILFILVVSFAGIGVFMT